MYFGFYRNYSDFFADCFDILKFTTNFNFHRNTSKLPLKQFLSQKKKHKTNKKPIVFFIANRSQQIAHKTTRNKEIKQFPICLLNNLHKQFKPPVLLWIIMSNEWRENYSKLRTLKPIFFSLIFFFFRDCF